MFFTVYYDCKARYPIYLRNTQKARKAPKAQKAQKRNQEKTQKRK